MVDLHKWLNGRRWQLEEHGSSDCEPKRSTTCILNIALRILAELILIRTMLEWLFQETSRLGARSTKGTHHERKYKIIKWKKPTKCLFSFGLIENNWVMKNNFHLHTFYLGFLWIRWVGAWEALDEWRDR